MDETEDDASDLSPGPAARRLSYKFQRLRERIRAAIDAGELAGKLPGERSLARQFNVNAKTLSKALTDLAAEGVLQRNIGLGTFVRDATVAQPATTRVMLLAGEGECEALTAALAERGLDVLCHSPDGDLPPSLIAPYEVILVASPDVDDDLVRDLIVRGKRVITVDREPRPYSTHALLPHATHAAMQAATDLVTLGHRRLLLVPDDPADEQTPRAVESAVPWVAVRTAAIADVPAAAGDGFTAVVCAVRTAVRVTEACRIAGVHVPNDLAMMAYGRLAGPPGWCGRYVTDAMIAEAIADLLQAGLPHKPLTLWLTGVRIDVGTAVPPRAGGSRPS